MKDYSCIFKVMYEKGGSMALHFETEEDLDKHIAEYRKTQQDLGEIKAYKIEHTRIDK